MQKTKTGELLWEILDRLEGWAGDPQYEEEMPYWWTRKTVVRKFRELADMIEAGENMPSVEFGYFDRCHSWRIQ